MISSSSRPTRPNFFPWSEALRLGYPCNLQDLDATRNCTVGVMNPDSAGVAALTADPLVFAIRDYPLVEPAGLRVHQARTNICLRSEQMGAGFQPPWVDTRATFVNDQTAAPDGVVDADLLREDGTAAATHIGSQSITVANSTQYTISIFAKEGTRYGFRMYYAPVSGARTMRCNTQDGDIAVLGGVVDAFGSEYWGAGWWRFWFTLTTGIADAGAYPLRLYLSNDDGTTASYNGDNASGLYLWGAQFEAGHSPSPYIETAAAAVSPVAPVYDYRQPKLIYHAGRDALEAECVISMPYVAPDNKFHCIYEIWEDANNLISLRWNPRVVGDRWYLFTETGGAVTAEGQASAFAPVAGDKYLLRLKGNYQAGAGATWTLDVYTCDATGLPTALVETITFTNAVTYPRLTCNRVYLGCTSIGTAQTDLHVWQVGS